MTKVMLDTDIIINLLKKDNECVQKFLALNNTGTKFYYNPVIIAEIYAGIYKKEIEDVSNFFDKLINIDIDKSTGIQAGIYVNQYRKAYNKISLEDYLIASCATINSLYLWTNNKKHYPMNEIQFI